MYAKFVEFVRDHTFCFRIRLPPARPPGFTSSGCMLSIVGQEQKLVRKDITYRRGVGHADPCTPFLLICALLHASSLHETIEGSSCSIIVLSFFLLFFFFFFFSIILPWFDLDLNFKDGEIRDCHRRRRIYLSIQREKDACKNYFTIASRYEELIVVQGWRTLDYHSMMILFTLSFTVVI